MSARTKPNQRHVSVSAWTYKRLQEHKASTGVSMAQVVEHVLRDVGHAELEAKRTAAARARATAAKPKP